MVRESAVKAGLTLAWSNGVTEGQTHRLKLLMRQGYGWAGFALIRQWAMQAAGAGMPRLLSRHTMSDTLAPLLVQATYICTSAVIVEAYLRFLKGRYSPQYPELGEYRG